MAFSLFAAMVCDFLGYIYGKTRRFIKMLSGRKRYNTLNTLNFATKKLLQSPMTHTSLLSNSVRCYGRLTGVRRKSCPLSRGGPLFVCHGGKRGADLM
jgi:hypothetical protein